MIFLKDRNVLTQKNLKLVVEHLRGLLDYISLVMFLVADVQKLVLD